MQRNGRCQAKTKEGTICNREAKEVVQNKLDVCGIHATNYRDNAAWKGEAMAFQRLVEGHTNKETR